MRRPGHKKEEKAHCASSCVLQEMDEVNAVKDILRDTLSRIDQIPSQSSESQSVDATQQQNLAASTNNNGLLSRAQNNFR